jgi:hypothetical protein
MILMVVPQRGNPSILRQLQRKCGIVELLLAHATRSRSSAATVARIRPAHVARENELSEAKIQCRRWPRSRMVALQAELLAQARSCSGALSVQLSARRSIRAT